ncbi:hypothetical protein Rsub_10718 [Raphidocelis subcapitata]|uniref:Uncharacterized protein n=1 Tax=Raphidocelis subcapitata TaxID=307507 RepID=A0A2V0PF32_9CHLO|nr:hypothetical protein Rsub_10718 [Raphidocelis subcapitata]|eukprot:GBF97582.1 hypothetical protein Rsub_10718 [Raphidocelis subcapitata]
MKPLLLVLLLLATAGRASGRTSAAAPSPPPPPPPSPSPPPAQYRCNPADGARCCAAGGSAPPGCLPCDAESRQPSKLFGCEGELWTAGGRLGYEWSWAGYRQGQEPLPELPTSVNLRTE